MMLSPFCTQDEARRIRKEPGAHLQVGLLHARDMAT